MTEQLPCPALVYWPKVSRGVLADHGEHAALVTFHTTDIDC
jgi:hypothetical protein